MGTYQEKYLLLFWSENHLEKFKILENFEKKRIVTENCC